MDGEERESETGGARRALPWPKVAGAVAGFAAVALVGVLAVNGVADDGGSRNRPTLTTATDPPTDEASDCGCHAGDATGSPSPSPSASANTEPPGGS